MEEKEVAESEKHESRIDEKENLGLASALTPNEGDKQEYVIGE